VTPEQLEEWLGRLLGIGTTVSVGLLAAGLVLWVAFGAHPMVQGVLTSGLLVLVATPVGRVVASTVGFAMQRDWQMVLMTGLVLVSLALSLVVALR